MGVEKRLPGGLPLATRGRLNAVFFQGAAHGCIREGIPEVGQDALDAVATPGRVFACRPLSVLKMPSWQRSSPVAWSFLSASGVRRSCWPLLNPQYRYPREIRHPRPPRPAQRGQ